MNQNTRIRTFTDEMGAQDYEEIPVSIEQFIKDDMYLGKATGNGKTVFPIWIDALKQIFMDDSKILIVFTGAIGTGKTTAAVIAICYVMYTLLCLRDAWTFYKKTSGGKMGITFFNLTKSLGDSRGFGKLQSFMLASPWFKKHAIGTPRMRDRSEYLDFALFRYLLASPYAKGFGTLGEDVICGILDEVDSPTEGLKQKERVLKAYENTVRRFESRFVQDGCSLGRLFLVASKQDELSFIDTFVAKMSSSDKVLVFDIPLWDAQPKYYFTGQKFRIAIGDAFHPPKILGIDEKSEEYIKEGYRILEVPVEFREEFDRDLIGSLRDLAGVTVAGARRSKLFPSEKFVKECFDETKEDPVTLPTIMIGLEDDTRLIWYLNVEKIRAPKALQRYMHCDIAFTGDALGLSMCCIKEWQEVDIEKEDGSYKKERMPVIETDFIMRIKAREGDRIPLHQVRRLVLDLRTLGYRIKFSADLKLASEDTTQILKKAGIEVKYVSVDRTDKPYVSWRNLVFEKRWVCHKHAMLEFEARHLEYDRDRGKIDHPDEIKDIEVLETGEIREVVMVGSKDCADAVAGAIEYCLVDSNVPVDVGVMKEVMERLASTTSDDKPRGLPMRDGSGQEIVAVKAGEKYRKLSEIIKKLR